MSVAVLPMPRTKDGNLTKDHWELTKKRTLAATVR
jgi:hypothetical protein